PPRRPRQLATHRQCVSELCLRDRPCRLVPLAGQDAVNQQCQARPGQEETEAAHLIPVSNYWRSPCARIANPVLVSDSFILSAMPGTPDKTKLKSTALLSPDMHARYRASWPDRRVSRPVGRFHELDHYAPLQIILERAIQEGAMCCRTDDARRL